MTRHTSRNDEASRTALLEVRTNSLSAVECAVQVSLDDLLPFLDGALEDARVGCAARVGDETVDLAKLLDDIGDELGDRVPRADVALVGLDFDAVGLGELFGVLLAAFGAGGVGDGEGWEWSACDGEPTDKQGKVKKCVRNVVQLSSQPKSQTHLPTSAALVQGREKQYVQAPISAHPLAASIPIPFGPEAPVTTTTLPFSENISRRELVVGII